MLAQPIDLHGLLLNLGTESFKKENSTATTT